MFEHSTMSFELNGEARLAIIGRIFANGDSRLIGQIDAGSFEAPIDNFEDNAAHDFYDLVVTFAAPRGMVSLL